jgi:hypothetical protein
MSVRRRTMLHLGLTTALIAVAAGALYAAAPEAGIAAANSSSAIADSGSRPRSFTVRVGSVSGLYPGKVQRLPVVFTNLRPFPIRIRTATTSAAGTARCPAGKSLLLRTQTFRHLVVRAHRSTRTTLRFGMLKTAPDACQHKSFAITVTARAVRA